MLALGIETSCDETSAAVVSNNSKPSLRVLSNIVYSQYDLHQIYGGVVPEIAARAHIDKINDVIDEALKKANVTMQDIDVICPTAGPGLIGGVIVGAMAGKALASCYNKPIVAVNHLEGHALSAMLTNDIATPFLLLLASGGHTQFILAKSIGQYQLLGQTLDDAIGESFDKVAKMLGLGMPGGPLVETLAKDGDADRYAFKVPLTRQKTIDLSFSGLKTNVRNTIIEQKPLNEQKKADICASFQHTVVKAVEIKTNLAIKAAKKHCPELQNIVVAGGVAANKAIRLKLEEIAQAHELVFTAPPLAICTDNAAMIAWAGLQNYIKNGEQGDDISFVPKARWPLVA